jgi:hypothetical protein
MTSLASIAIPGADLNIFRCPSLVNRLGKLADEAGCIIEHEVCAKAVDLGSKPRRECETPFLSED